MNDNWWSLPSNKKFVSNIIKTIHCSKNVLICLPVNIPDITSTLKSNFREYDSPKKAKNITLKNSMNEEPLEVLYEIAEISYKPSDLYSIDKLLHEGKFTRKLFWIKDTDISKQKKWLTFINDYHHKSRNIDEYDRSIFCLVINEHIIGLSLPEEDVCLSIFKWENILSDYEMNFFVHSFVDAEKLNSVNKLLKVELITNLAIFDPGLAEYLNNFSINDLLNPIEILKQYGSEKGWNGNKAYTKNELFQLGIVNKVNNEKKTHSSFLALKQNLDEIDRRIWMAQIKVLFPYIEDQRRSILENTKDRLCIPFETKDNRKISSWKDLELGHIYYQMTTSDGFSNELKYKVKRLKDLRNKLSHLEPIKHWE